MKSLNNASLAATDPVSDDSTTSLASGDPVASTPEPSPSDIPPGSPDDATPDVGESARPCDPQSQLPDPSRVVEGGAKLLRAVWPSSDLQHLIADCDPETGEFRHTPVKDLTRALERAAALDEEGFNVYFACGEYLNGQSRTAANAHRASAFWLDVDCGPAKAASGRGYADADAAHEALTKFCESASLPLPTHVVNSGGGLHGYWALSTSLEREPWQSTARTFKALTQAHGLLADPSRTADIASVLRLPGTRNHKYEPPKPVTLLHASDEPIDTALMVAAIEAAHRSCTEALPVVAREPQTAANDETRVSSEVTYKLPDLPRLESALKCLSPDCDETTWKLHRLGPLAHAAREHPVLADKLKELAQRWSSGELRGEPSKAWSTPGASNGRTGEEIFESTWQRFLRESYTGRPTTLGTIYHDAREVGWSPSPGESAPDVDDDGLSGPLRVIAAAIHRARCGDVGAPLERECVAALTVLYQEDQAQYQRFRNEFKKAKGVLVGALDAAVKAGLVADETPATHHGYARDLIAHLTVEGWAPVGHEGALYVVDPKQNIWVRKEPGAMVRIVAETHDGKDNCGRRADYTGIALHATELVTDPAFFAEAPVGLACPDGFYRVTANGITCEPLTPAHRQRVMLGVSPRKQPMPMFDKFLHETFESPRDGEEQQQIQLVQEIAGAIMLGLMHRHHKGVLLWEPYGRAGKGTLERILTALVPKEFVTAVSPFRWGHDYHLAMLAGARLNVVGELPENEPIPAAAVKSVLGGDLLTGRNPHQRPITFKNEAAHVFTSNHFINSRDQSDAFFARWIAVEFPNSRLKSGAPLNPTLAQDIIDNELSPIAQWALEGAERLLRNGKFSSSAAHDRLMDAWRRSTNSLVDFIHECCDRGEGKKINRKALYNHYKDWCGDNNRKAFSKGRVRDLLEHNIALGITWATLDGYEIFRGVDMKPGEDDDEFDYGLVSRPHRPRR